MLCSGSEDDETRRKRRNKGEGEREADKEGRRLVPQFRRQVKNMAADIIKTLADAGQGWKEIKVVPYVELFVSSK